jgi:ribonuclease HI
MSSSFRGKGASPDGSGSLFPNQTPPDSFLIAHIDGGARGNPGPAAYGVLLTDQAGRKVAALSDYLGHQTNNYAEYSGLLAALDYALQNGYKALKVVADSELLVKQIRGEYKVKSPSLLELYQRARKMIGQLEWFSIQHVLRGKNQEADRLANFAMDQGMGRNRNVTAASGEDTRRSADVQLPPSSQRLSLHAKEFSGVVRDGVIVLEDAELPEGTRVQVRVRE